MATMVTTRERVAVRAALVTVLLVGVGAGSGCGDTLGAQPAPSPSTVFVTLEPTEQPEPTADLVPESTPPVSAGPTQEPSGDPEALPRQNRGFDVLLVDERTDTDDGTVLSFDRLTVVGLDDGRLASEGTEVRVDDGDAFANQTVTFYEVGVSPDARFFLTTCTATGSGPSISSEGVGLEAFLAAPGLAETAVTVTYDAGLLVRAETNPRC